MLILTNNKIFAWKILPLSDFKVVPQNTLYWRMHSKKGDSSTRCIFTARQLSLEHLQLKVKIQSAFLK